MNSIEFLKAFHPTGPWVLTGILANRKGIQVDTFGPDTEAEATAWLAQYNGKRNIYFSVNKPLRAVTKKTSKTDIDLVPWLHVDIDPRARDDDSVDPATHHEQEVARIRKLILEECPVLPPTAVVFSGGGYQAFWRLKEPLRVAGDLARAEDIELYNQQLEIALGGDSCFNIDRIMRLPGTLNIPDAKKTAKGRTPQMATVALYEPTRVYSIDQFRKAPKLQTANATIGNHTVSIPTGNIERVQNIEELDKWKVPDRVRVIIVQGYEPDNPKPGDNSRSEWLFDAVCNLVRCNVPDEVIYSIITDPDWAISASVLDKGSNIQKYATRQIQRAKEHVEEPWLERLNRDFIVIGNYGGKCRVVEQWYDETMKRAILTHQSFEDFRNRWCNQYVSVGKKEIPAGNWWLKQPNRRQADRLIFAPGRNLPGTYNLWQGFACDSIPGNMHESYLEHVFNNVCSGNAIHYEYMLNWLARCVQYPDRVGETAVVLRGRTGTGKTFFVDVFGSLWGRHFLSVSNAKHLVGSFNAHFRDCVVVFGDEAFFAGDRSHESVLKTLITSHEINIEPKGIDLGSQPNFLHLIMASNADWVVPSGEMERRFFVIDMGDKHQRDGKYFSAIKTDIEHSGRENLLHFLLNRNIEEFDVRDVPITVALNEQKLHSLGVMESWWFNRISEGTLLPTDNEWTDSVPIDELNANYINTCMQYGVQRRGSAIRLGMFLDKMCPGAWPKRIRTMRAGVRKSSYQFPALEVVRRHWENRYGAVDWPADDDEPLTPTKPVF